MLKKKEINLFLDSIDEYVICLNSKKCVIRYSNKLAEILNITDELIRSKQIFDINNTNIIDFVLNQNDMFNSKFIFRNKKNDKLIFNIKLKIFDNKKINYFVILTDITSRENKEYEFNQKLEETINLSNEKTKFLSRVSHEIRTPINGIIGMNDIAKNAIKENKYNEALDAILKVEYSSKYLLSLVENVLNMSRFESGKMVLENSECNLAKVLSDVYNIVYSSANTKNQKLLFDKIEDVRIICDVTKLTQILVNILGNSIKYTDIGGKIKLNCLVLDKVDKYEINIVIKDNGIGMSKEFLNHIYEPFSQENKNANVSGTGLGLAITKNLVTLMNGTIKYSSTEGLGTTVNLTFIFDKSYNNNKKENENIIDYSKYRVLVAEDNEINQIVIKKHLEFYNFKFDVVSDGEEVVEKFENSEFHYYDVILMDIHMPNMDGIEACQIIRQLNRVDNDILIIAMSADVLRADIEKFLLAGMDNHISKPIIRDKMIDVISQTLTKKNKIK